MNTQDIIYIHAIKVRTVIGILPHERAMKQTLIIDCELGTDTRAAGASDDIADALNYAAICDSITAFAASADYQLLEAFAEPLPPHCSNNTRQKTSASTSRNRARWKPPAKSACAYTARGNEAL